MEDIIGEGIIKGGMEMMERNEIKDEEDLVSVGYKIDVEEILIVEMEGNKVEVDYMIGRVEKIEIKKG